MSDQVAILGGAFNPPHIGHIKIARTALEQLSLDRVILIPTGKAPHPKNEEPIDGKLRVLMTRVALCAISPANLKKKIDEHFKLDQSEIAELLSVYEKHHRDCRDARIAVSGMEVESACVCGQATYTVDTLRKIRSLEPDWELFLLIGGDQAEQFERWKDYREILEIARVVVAKRPGFSTDAIRKAFPEFRFLDFEELAVSSSEIRERLRQSDIPDEIPETLRILLKSIDFYK